MSDRLCNISFPGTNYPSITLEKHANLALHLTVQNSPVLFGCRTGICGTCMAIVTGDIPPPDPDEIEVLETLADGSDRVRLACQLDLTNDIEIRTVL
jgi:ferredoxin